MSSYKKIIFNIDKVLKDKNISKNKLRKKIDLQKTLLNSYCKIENIIEHVN